MKSLEGVSHALTLRSVVDPSRHTAASGNAGVQALKRAIEEPDRYVLEVKVDAFRGLVVIVEDGTVRGRTSRSDLGFGATAESSAR